MEATFDIGVVIVGAGGERGGAAVEILPKLRAAESAHGIHLELVCLAEAKEDLRPELCAKVAALLGSSCPVVGILAEAIPHALRWLADGDGRRKVIVYDATPTIHHYLHLMIVLPHSEREQIYYFGEKPLFTKQGEIDFIEHTFPGQTFFCELIETENPVFRAANQFIHSQGFKIESMSFWRASCMGVSIAVGDARGGVEGGALLDKVPHDLSIAIGLIGRGDLMQWSVTDVRTHLLALHESAFRLNKRNFLSIASTALEDISSSARIPEKFPAAALFSFDVDLRLQENSGVPVTFLASWVGIQNTQIERRFADRLAVVGMDIKEWLNSEEPKVSRDLQYRYQNEEVRMALVEGLLAGRKAQLVLNLLGKFGGRRFVRLLDENGRSELILQEEDGQDYHEKKDADLLCVFKRVVEHCAGLGSAEHVGAEATILVHKIMLSALRKANDQIRGIDQDQAYNASLLAYRRYLASANR